MSELNQAKLDAVVINPTASHTFSIIWLHGLGADGDDFSNILKDLAVPNCDTIKLICPHAPKRPITINNGLIMRGWYDVQRPDLCEDEDTAGIKEAAEILNAYIDHEIQIGIEPQRIIIVGFSQGGAIALYTGINRKEILAGILVLSAYLPLANTLVQAKYPELPIAIMHGQHDPIIPLSTAEESYHLLQQAGYGNINFNCYDMAHALCRNQLNDIHDWLVKHLI